MGYERKLFMDWERDGWKDLPSGGEFLTNVIFIRIFGYFYRDLVFELLTLSVYNKYVIKVSIVI